MAFTYRKTSSLFIKQQQRYPGHGLTTGDITEDIGLLARIRMKPIRSLSGVSTVTVLTEPHPCTGLRRRTVCRDGPVFDADEIDWEHLR